MVSLPLRVKSDIGAFLYFKTPKYKMARIKNGGQKNG